jgi:hypothetical protein
MQRNPNLPVMIIGAVLVLAPLGITFIASEREKVRAIDFYQVNPNSATFPKALESANNVGYQWACFGIGAGIAFAGLHGKQSCGTVKPEAWERAEV